MQIFHRSTNTLSRVSIFGLVFMIAAVLLVTAEIQRSPYVTMVNVAPEQPVPFSHEHHVSGLGIDCRYCHTSVEQSSFAGIPPTKTCMNCHSQIWSQASMLEPVRESFRSGRSLIWTRVNDLPDFVYFDHSVHVQQGVGCATCHGAVDRMPLTYAAKSLQMEWCLDCHRAPEKYLRPAEEVFNMQYAPPTPARPMTVGGKSYDNQIALGNALKQAYKIRSTEHMVSCNTCHR